VSELFRGFWVIGYREILRLLAQRARLLSSLATPLLFFALFGAGFNRLVGQLAPGVDFVTFMYPGVLAMTVIMPAVFTGMSVVWDREFGFLREVLVAPLSRTGIVLGKVSGGAAVATAEGLVLLALAPFLGIGLSVTQVAELVPLLLALASTVSCLGLLIGSRLRSQEVFQTVMALLILPLIFLSGIFFPVDAVPDWLSALTKANPVTYGVDAIRQILLGAPSVDGAHPLGVTVFGHTLSVLEEVAIIVGLGAVLLAGATWSFSRTP
jgi:ABC-2 type transport system permease protein